MTIITVSKMLEAGLTYGQVENYLVLLDYDGNILERNFRDGYEMMRAAEERFRNEEFGKAKELFLRALETKISISTKITAAKKLARIGKLTNDEDLLARFTGQASSLESEKEVEKTRRAERAAEQALPLARRLKSRSRGADDEDGEEHTADELLGDAAEREYWGKRWKQIEEEGGS